MIRRVAQILILAVLVLGRSALTPAVAHERGADLSRLVVVGDSLSAGFQNGSLLAEQQVHGYAALIAAQARVRLVLPLISDPGIPNVLELTQPGAVIARKPGEPGTRINPLIQVTNLAVPGATVADALTGKPDCDFTPPADAPPVRQLVNLLTDVVLGLPGCLVPSPLGPIRLSQVEWAEVLHPTTIVMWLGNNDVLGAAQAGDSAAVTPATAFKAAYVEALDRLAATRATIVVANIPDVTVLPFLTPAEEALELLAAGTGGLLSPAVLAAILGIGPGDFVTPDAFDVAATILARISAGIPAGPLPGHVVLDAGEVATIRAATEDFNAFIARRARATGAALVDIHALLQRAEKRGIVVADRRLTTDFLGGLFSLDGVHPTNTGYAIVANEFIDTLNRRFDADIPPVRVHHVLKQDPLVFDD